MRLAQLPPAAMAVNGVATWHSMWRGPRRDMLDPLRLQYQASLSPPQSISGAKFLRQLNELSAAEGAQAFTTSRADTTRLVVQVPGVAEPVHLLRRTADDGTIADLVRLNAVSDRDISAAMADIAQRAEKPKRVSAQQKNREEMAQASGLALVPDRAFFRSQMEGKAQRKAAGPVMERYMRHTGA